MLTKKHTLLVAILASASVAYAQDTALVTDIIATPNYFVTVLFGVMLAIGFQFLLTSLSLAIGVSAIPNLKESYVESRYGKNNNNKDNTEWHETQENTDTGVMISSAFGVWNVITAAISLFGATALALTLTPVVTTTIAITLGLTIWAVFYLLMFYLEGKMVGTAIGSLISTAVSGLRAGADTVKSLFTPSPASQVQSVADSTIEKFRTEMSAAFDTDGIANAINGFTSKLDKNVNKAAQSLDKASTKIANKVGDLPSYDQLKNDLQQTLTDAQKNSGSNPAKWTAIQSAIQTAIDQSGSDNNGSNDSGKKDRIEQLKGLVAQFQSGNSGASKRQDGVQLSQSYDDYLAKLQNWIDGATPDDFDTEQLTTSVRNFFNDPRGTSTAVLDKVKTLDKQTVIQMLTKNTSLEKEQIENYADKVTETISTIQANANNLVDEKTISDIQNKVMSFINGAQQQVNNLTSNSNGTSSGFDFASLKNQFMSLINNPADSYDTVMGRIKNYRRDDLVNTLVANTSLTHDDINKAVGQFEDAQNTVKDQLQAAADAANSAKNQAARRAVIQADGARKAAVAASWWLFAAIVLSGVAAVFGAQTGI